MLNTSPPVLSSHSRGTQVFFHCVVLAYDIITSIKVGFPHLARGLHLLLGVWGFFSQHNSETQGSMRLLYSCQNT